MEKQFELQSIMKASAETTHNGQTGVFIEGMAIEYGQDRDNEIVKSVMEAAKVYFANNPVVVYSHRKHGVIGDTAIGQVVSHKFMPSGVQVKVFVPKPTWEPLLDIVYNPIKSGALKAFSWFGRAIKRGKNLFVDDLQEITITPIGANPRALFTVVSKAFESEEDWGADAKQAHTLNTQHLEALEGSDPGDGQDDGYLASIEKAGRTISAKNMAELSKALEALQGALGAVALLMERAQPKDRTEGQ